MNFFSNLFKTHDDADFTSLIQNGAIVVDVRTVEEYKMGHVKNSINIPLDELGKKLSSLDKNKNIITVCQSGMRSKSAKQLLLKNGFTLIYNGGSWLNIKNYVK